MINEDITYPSSKGVDGNAGTDMFKGSCFHTDLHNSPWWQVNLTDVFCISEIKLTNRGDCCGLYLSYVYITLHITRRLFKLKARAAFSFYKLTSTVML